MSSSRHSHAAASPSPSPRRRPSPATPTRRSTSAPSLSLQEAARTPVTRRNTLATAASPAPSSTARRSPRPAWNGYLTDDKQYKLTREKQLVRQMQQLSTAHFRAHASPLRRRFEDVHEDSDGQRMPGEDMLHSPLSDAPLQRSRRREYDWHRADSSVQDRTPGSPARLQSELSVLEGMLSDLEQESERLKHHDPIQLNKSGGSNVWDDDDYSDGYGAANEEEETVGDDALSVVYEDDDGARESVREPTEHDEELFDDPVTQVCYKSLRIGMELTQKMQLMAQRLDRERHQRKLQQRHIRELDALCRATQERSDEVEARYEDLASQVDAMRDAMIATEEALHRVSHELVRAREPISFTTHFGEHTVFGGSVSDPEARETGSWRGSHAFTTPSALHHSTNIDSDLIHH